MTRPLADWLLCPGVVCDGLAGHAMRDECWSCAPFWEVIPICSICTSPRMRLRESGWCGYCRRYYDVADPPTTGYLLLGGVRV